MMLIVLQAILLIGLPAVLIYIQKQVTWFKPIVLAYVVGVVVGNVVPGWFNAHLLSELTGISVIIAIPLLLFPTRLKQWAQQPKSMLGAYAIAAVATMMAVAVGYFLFNVQLSDISLISGMVTGVYTGGTVNLNAIGFAFDVPNATMVLLNGYDMAVSGAYLLFIFLVGEQFARFLGKKKVANITEQPFHLKEREPVKNYVWSVLTAVGVVGVTAGLSIAFTGKLNELFMVFGVSVLGVAVANIKWVASNNTHMPSADYLMIVFGLCLGLQANVSELFAGSLTVFQYFITVFTIMLVLHYVISKLFKVDGNESILASVAAVFGPPFIGPVASALNAPGLIPAGIAIALMGNALGTYLGMVVVYLLS